MKIVKKQKPAPETEKPAQHEITMDMLTKRLSETYEEQLSKVIDLCSEVQALEKDFLPELVKKTTESTA